MRPIAPSALACLALLLAAACDSPKPSPNPFETKKETVEPPPLKEAPKPPPGPPEFSVDEEGAKIGWSYILIEKEEGKRKLAVVGAMVHALEAGGAAAVTISTDSRPEYPKSVKFAPSSTGKSAQGCSVVTKVLAERRNAVWSLKGGTAVKSPKGLAGPDMAMTADSLEAAAKRCKDSDVVFVSADPDVEWGLVYDLAAATQTLEKAKLGKVVLLEPAPTAGRPVSLN